MEKFEPYEHIRQRLNVSVDPDRGCQHSLAKSVEYGSHKLAQSFIKSRYTEAFPGIGTEFNKHISRDKVSYLSKLYEGESENKEEHVRLLMDRRKRQIEEQVEEKRLMGKEAWERLRGTDRIALPDTAVQVISVPKVLPDRVKVRKDVKKVISITNEVKKNLSGITNKFIQR